MNYQIDMKLLVRDWEQVPEKLGVYAFYNKNKEVIYVGKSINLHERLRQHLHGVTVGNTENIKHHFYTLACVFLDDEIIMNKLEIYLIKKHRPIYNVQHNSQYTEKYNREHIHPKIVKRLEAEEEAFAKRYAETIEGIYDDILLETVEMRKVKEDDFYIRWIKQSDGFIL